MGDRRLLATRRRPEVLTKAASGVVRLYPRVERGTAVRCLLPTRSRSRNAVFAILTAVFVSLAGAVVMSAGQTASRSQRPPAAQALGSDAGILVTRESGGRVVIRFTGTQPRRVRRLVGKAVGVRCFRYGSAGLGPSEMKISSATAPLRSLAKPVRTAITGRYDACTVLDPATSAALAHVPLSALGLDHIDEDATLTRIIVAASIAGREADAAHVSTYPPTAELARTLPARTVALERQEDSPAQGQLGVFTDGARHLEVVALTRSGRRIFLDFTADVVSTNAFRALGEVQSGRAP
jgi:hypothetical protein